METISFPSDQPLAVVAMTNHPNMALHQHTHWELVIVTAGSGVHYTAQGGWPVQPGDVYMIPVGLAHGYRQCNDLALTNILFRPAGLQFPESLTCLPAYRALIDLEPRQRAYHNFQGHLHISDEYFSDVVQQARDIEREYQQQALAWQASGSAGLIRLLVTLCRLYEQAGGQAVRNLQKLAQAQTFIDGQLSSALAVGSIAQHCAMSERSLQRLFTTELQTTIQSYILDKRLQRAEHLLQHSNQPIHAIAKACGFSRTSYFGKRFRAYCGCSPSDFRKTKGDVQH